LLESYRAACRIQRDQRFGDAGRARKVALLDDEILCLCTEMACADPQSAAGLDHDFDLLVCEVLRLMMKQELFTFVTAPAVQLPNGTTKPVDGTNNEAERTLRSPAQARDTGRTNKSHNGTRRQTIVTTVLESLRLYLQTFTLGSVLEELERWWTNGQSCFTRLLKKHKLKSRPSGTPIIDQLFPRPSPTPTG